MGKETGENVPQEALGRKTGEDGKKISASRFPGWKNDCVRNSLALQGEGRAQGGGAGGPLPLEDP